METGIQSSFIPHDAGEIKSVSPRLGGSGFADLLVLLAIVLLVASIALAGGVFLYKQYLETSTNSKLEQLQRAKAAFEPSLIQQLTRLDDRMHAAATILGNHIAPSVMFSALEQATLATISFKSLNFETSDGEHITIKMDGVAQSVNSIALQAQLFSKNGVVTSPIFSGIARDTDGVRFSLSALINPTSINYTHSLSAPTQGPVPGQGPNQTQPVNGQTPTSGQPSQQSQQPASPFGGTTPVQGQ